MQEGHNDEPDDQGNHDDPTRPAGCNGSLVLAAGGLPYSGFHQPAAVQRHTGQDVEDTDHQVCQSQDVREHGGYAGQGVR
ncbi:hypothetical protein D3C86_1955520 [compost metagenome]